MIEETLIRIASALERMAAVEEAIIGRRLTQDAPANPEVEAPKPVRAKNTKKEPAEVKPEAAKEITLADISNGLRDLITSKGAQVAKEVLSKFGATKLSGINTADYTKFIAAVNDAKDAK